MNDDIYVRKDVYEAEQKRVDARIDSEDKRIDDLKDSVSRSLTLLGWGMTFLVVLADCGAQTQKILAAV